MMTVVGEEMMEKMMKKRLRKRGIRTIPEASHDARHNLLPEFFCRHSLANSSEKNHKEVKQNLKVRKGKKRDNNKVSTTQQTKRTSTM